MIKCIAWDLDNTIWNGIYDANDKLILKENILHILQDCYNKGIVNTIVSKNDKDLIIPILKKFNIEKYFLLFNIGWQSKYIAIKNIQKSLNIGADSILFVDDSDFELFQVKYYIPKINILNSLKYIEIPKIILKDNYFSDESSNRIEIYRILEKRKTFENTLSRKDFLKLCKININIRYAEIDDIDRIIELSNRSNQFNSTLERLNKEVILNYFNNPNYKIILCELNDIFCDYGIVGISILFKNNDHYFISYFTISCKAEGKNVGHTLFTYILNLSQNDKFKYILAKFKYSEKNKKLQSLFSLFNFKNMSDNLLLKEISTDNSYLSDIYISKDSRKNMKIKKFIRNSLVELLGTNLSYSEPIFNSSRFNFDSIIFINLILQLEEEFSISIPLNDETIENLKTINLFSNYIEYLSLQ